MALRSISSAFILSAIWSCSWQFSRGLSYTYPGSTEPALRDINLSIKAGETLAIVGLNGSGTGFLPLSSKLTTNTEKPSQGKSTLAKVLLRILDFDTGSLNVNGVDIRSYDPSDYHKHTTAVFQGFSKFNSTVKENVGLGNVEKIGYRPAITQALYLAEADGVVGSLPKGLKTVLETPGFDSISYPGMANSGFQQRHGLSGGEVSIFVSFFSASSLVTIVLITWYFSGNG